ncbi:MAG: response regulator [Cyanobacteria bacterium SID2]|nr:response regulator [Cyanobacteria bacterium SID2]MBP0002754.1 response regulator [Cyanobacteria bacterium SBC]
MSTVLVVEDSRMQRECITHQLKWSGLDAIPACDGVEALERVEESCPDVVLMDLVMPNLDGYAACRLLKSNPQTHHVPVIMVTGNSQPIALYWSLKHAEAYISKPWHPRDLLTTIDRTIADNHPETTSPSVEAWTDYGWLLFEQGRLYERRRDAATRYGLKVMRLYEFSIEAFEKALELNPSSRWATRSRVTAEKARQSWQETLESVRPCQACDYYYGRDGIHCAPHPLGVDDGTCSDWTLPG